MTEGQRMVWAAMYAATLNSATTRSQPAEVASLAAALAASAAVETMSVADSQLSKANPDDVKKDVLGADKAAARLEEMLC